MSVPAYVEYKDSGVPWLGVVPRHWDIGRIKDLFEIQKRIAGELGHDVLSITQSGLKVKDIDSNDGQVSMDYSKYQLVYPGDFAMNHMDLLTGWIDIATMQGVTSPDYRVFSTRADRDVVPAYYLYVFQMAYSQRQFYPFGQGSSQLGRWRLPTDAFNAFSILQPPVAEQEAIRLFLDRETAKIDSLVAEQERLIALLKEKRQAVISHAVTKGLNPNAPMKDSGIEWLGEIPAYWRQTRTSREFKLGMGQTILSETLDEAGDWPVFSATEGDHYFGRIFEPNLRLAAGDLIIPARGNSIGHIKIASEPCTTTQTTIYAKILNRDKISPAYAYWFMRGLKKWLFPFVQTAIPQITTAEIGANVILIPEMSEQQAIVDHVKCVVAEYESLISQAQSAITILQERRAALISAAVTGKIDVRGLVTLSQELEVA